MLRARTLYFTVTILPRMAGSMTIIPLAGRIRNFSSGTRFIEESNMKTVPGRIGRLSRTMVSDNRSSCRVRSVDISWALRTGLIRGRMNMIIHLFKEDSFICR
jgi:hypothetical protein